MLYFATQRKARTAAEEAEDRVLAYLNDTLPQHWIVLGLVPPKRFEKGRRRTHEFDALVLTEKLIFVIEVKSHSGTIRVRSGKPFQRDGKEIQDRTNQPSGFWYYHEHSTYNLKALLKERFHVDSAVVVPKIVMVGAGKIEYGDSGLEEDVVDKESFVRAAIARENQAKSPPLSPRLRSRIACFLADDDSISVSNPSKESVKAVTDRQPHVKPQNLDDVSLEQARTAPVHYRGFRGYRLANLKFGIDEPINVEPPVIKNKLIPRPIDSASHPRPEPNINKPKVQLSLSSAVKRLRTRSGSEWAIIAPANVRLCDFVASIVHVLVLHDTDERILVVHPQGSMHCPWVEIKRLCGENLTGWYHAGATLAHQEPERIVVASLEAVTCATHFPFPSFPGFSESLRPFGYIIAVDPDLFGVQRFLIENRPQTSVYVMPADRSTYLEKRRLPDLLDGASGENQLPSPN